MAKIQTKKYSLRNDVDAVYFLKLVVILILGSTWVKVSDGLSWQFPLPLGMLVGYFFIRKQRLKNDRKIMYSLLLASMLIGFWAQLGIFIRV